MYIFNYSLFGKNLHGDDDDDLKEKTWYVCDEVLFLFLGVSGVHLSPASSECSLLTQCVNECACVRQYMNVFNTLKSDRYAVILAYVRECVRLFCLLKYVVMFLPFPSFLFSHLS